MKIVESRKADWLEGRFSADDAHSAAIIDTRARTQCQTLMDLAALDFEGYKEVASE